MAQMPSSKPFSYILERERQLDSTQQTIFWIRPRKAAATAAALERASKARKVTRDGSEYFEQTEWLRGEQANFVETIWKIDNYHFSDDFPEYSDKPINIGETDDDLKKKVFTDLPDGDRLEIMNAQTSASKLSGDATKKLNTSATTLTGNLTTLNG